MCQDSIATWLCSKRSFKWMNLKMPRIKLEATMDLDTMIDCILLHFVQCKKSRISRFGNVALFHFTSEIVFDESLVVIILQDIPIGSFCLGVVVINVSIVVKTLHPGMWNRSIHFKVFLEIRTLKVIR
jgi:hypothetical protein